MICPDRYTRQGTHFWTGPTLRGYVDLGTGVAPAPQYLGPVIVAQRDRPVRVKLTNQLGTGTAGNLPLPVDTTLMGAGQGPLGGPAYYTQNRTSMHNHGAFTPWISDGTPHQWFTPAGETNSYLKGVSFHNVPDMPDPGSPGHKRRAFITPINRAAGCCFTTSTPKVSPALASMRAWPRAI